MRQATWRVGWYSKVILTIIAVSLVGLLVRQLPGKVEAKPERFRITRVDVVALDAPHLRGDLDVHLRYEERKVKEGKLPIIDPEQRVLAQQVIEQTRAEAKDLLVYVLAYRYALGYRVKFMNDDFIILESE